MRASPLLTLLAAFAFLAQTAPASAAAGLLYERTLMVEANRRCRLFSPAIATALSSAARQAEVAARRESPPAVVRAVQRRARAKADAAACASADLATAAERVRVGYAGWAKLPRMTFPGPASAWRADRGVSVQPRWRLAQTLRLGAEDGVFGLAATAGRSPELLAVARFKHKPAFARLALGGRTYLAESRGAAPKSLSKEGKGEALAFRFPLAAASALADLPYGQTARLDFVTTGWTGEHTSSTRIEVGDYAAAQAFLAAGV